MKSTKKQTVVIVGAGASGLAASIKLKQLNPKLNVIILEKNDRIAKKILKTGNGRCNIGNLDMNSNYYNNSKFLEDCFSRFSVEDLIDFFKSLGLLIKSDDASRLYPYSETATSVVEVFRYEISKLGIDLRLNNEVLGINYKDDFIIKTNNGIVNADYVIMATGSIAQETTNTYQILERLGHKTTDLRAGLVPFKVKENLKMIQGIRVKCLATVYNKSKFIFQETGEILFKESGLSGILSLNLSRYVSPGYKVSLDMFYDRDTILDEIKELLNKKDLENVLLGILPKMLVVYILKNYKDLENNLERLRDISFEVTDFYPIEQAQITIGGIRVSEVNYHFSSNIFSNLYIVGETLDIDGSSGGYNLHFAWMSGILAATSINSKI